MDKVGPVGTFGLIWVTPAALPGSLQPTIGLSMHNIYWPVRNTYMEITLSLVARKTMHIYFSGFILLMLNNR